MYCNSLKFWLAQPKIVWAKSIHKDYFTSFNPHGSKDTSIFEAGLLFMLGISPNYDISYCKYPDLFCQRLLYKKNVLCIMLIMNIIDKFTKALTRINNLPKNLQTPAFIVVCVLCFSILGITFYEIISLNHHHYLSSTIKLINVLRSSS
jgi:hypothetical protein